MGERADTSMQLAVIGTGHVGLVTAVALARLGHRVAATDADEEKVSRLRSGRSPFYEPELQGLIEAEAGAGRLRFEAGAGRVVPGAGVVFICVGTPPAADGEASLLAVERSAVEVANAASDGVVVVEKSTVPAGTAERIAMTLARERPGLRFDVASNPEFLREGSAVHDSLEPDRILVGAESDRAFSVLRSVYEPLTRAGVTLIETDIATAELAKHACNAFLATKISFINALARICDLVGADVEAVAEVMGSDPRIGPAFLKAGIGYGGFCFPKDLAAFERLSSRLGYEFGLLEEVARINEEAADAAVAKLRDAVWNLEDKRIALLGLAFKPGTDDVRLSPALSVARRLLGAGARVVGYDPQAAANAKAEVPALELAEDANGAIRGSHAIVLATDWPEFERLDLERAKGSMSYAVIVDGRNLLDPAAAADAGFAYYAMGRPSIAARQGKD